MRKQEPAAAKHCQIVSLLTSTRKNNKFLAPAATYYLSIEPCAAIEKLSSGGAELTIFLFIHTAIGVKGLDYRPLPLRGRRGKDLSTVCSRSESAAYDKK